ncbi:MAG: hypothetical protein ACPGF7_03970 [Pontibacterium sp.]
MQIYLVGGAVRDQLLHYPVYDKDWVVVGATPDAMLAKGFKPVGKDFPVFIHPGSGEEYALARTERKSGKGYTGFQYFAAPDVTLEEDLQRRDLTINAIAQSADGTLIDPYHGQQDIEQRILRHVSPAFAEDPLRVLRVARFAARYHHLGFRVAEETLTLMQTLSESDELNHLVAERVWKESERAFNETSPYTYIELLKRCGALSVLFPEWLSLFDNASIQSETESVLSRLKQQSGQGIAVFSCLMTLATRQLPPEQAHLQITRFCERLRTPKLWLEQALQVQRWHSEISRFAALNGRQRFEIIQALDLLRRPQRLAGILICCQALHNTDDSPATLFFPLLERLNQLEASALIAEGFKGKALGDELNRRRQQLCCEPEG